MLHAQFCQLFNKTLVKICWQLYSASMKTNMTTGDIRRHNLQLLIDESEERTAIALAKKCQTSHSYLSQILTQFPTKNGTARILGPQVARKLEIGCGKPEGWMDQLHDDIDPAESELVNIFRSLDEDKRAILLQQGKLILQLGR